uniref:Aminotransferase class V domain-containing protein n=1 Tax=Compsopogon caeruleus TaxID=31354 RepID=A0A7S1T6B5_9RHOD|mmetsp:Transcript_1158/g.2422  ORF Transcript_1158/g.2422 Transcript_1158/m.2422 type:complete len:551 (+) Transcript_1158:64-1716(+)|eukprot:CAMPEP_0184687776 /NCGR_PEP_ID=MMETSP0312-20130426/27524_1 /TAXON_ID=31354 /ORGANISM="Compsopogon coeruleus, Strain SAG 36.94" /LENGTH=550 /DNA_ID=CAMNT_0027144259 /DNA_START=62 /DNA_END=1714 /DNA_ORIENTATION=-
MKSGASLEELLQYGSNGKLSDEDILELVRWDVVGRGVSFSTPFGRRALVYCDHFASAPALGVIEEYIWREVLPLYANTHTEATATGVHTSEMREAARETVRRCVHGHDAHIFFTGNGVTGAINQFIHMLGLERKKPSYLQLIAHRRPVVFISEMEHNANFLPWKQCDVILVIISSRDDGLLDLDQLTGSLKKYKNHSMKVGAFTAGSNLTGIKQNVREIAQVLRNHGAISFFDFAGVGPYVDIDARHFDAAAVSPHKFLGGPQTRGVLIVSKRLLRKMTSDDVEYIPYQVGGGIVSFAVRDSHRWLSHPEAREEAGTPAIVGDIRVGAVFAIKEAIGVARIERLEESHWNYAKERLSRLPDVILHGSAKSDRVPVLSISVRVTRTKFAHCSLVSQLLNDLFGIQSRPGCMCAGMYAEMLLNIDSKPYTMMVQRYPMYKPGVTRLSLHYTMTHDDVVFVMDAIEWISKHIALLVRLYKCDLREERWVIKPQVAMYRDRLDSEVASRAGIFEEAEKVLDIAASCPAFMHAPPEKYEYLRWFAFESDLNRVDI